MVDGLAATAAQLGAGLGDIAARALPAALHLNVMTSSIDEGNAMVVNFCGVLEPFEEELAGERVVTVPCAV